jgi:hypothetical protein
MCFLFSPAWSCPPQVFNSVYFRVRICESKFEFFVQWNVFMQNFWNFQVIPTIKIISTLVQNKLVLKNSSNSYRQVYWSDESFYFAFELKMKWHLVGHKRFKCQFEGYWEPNRFKAFILFAWIMNWPTRESTTNRSRLLAFDLKGLD